MSDGLNPVVIRSNAVDKVQRVRTLLSVQQLDRAALLKSIGLRPVGSLLFHLPVRIAPAFECFQRLLQALGYIAAVDQSSTKVNDFVDVLNQERALLFAGATACARPDFIFGID